MGNFFTQEGIAAFVAMVILAFALGVFFRIVMSPGLDTPAEWLFFIAGSLAILSWGAGFLMNTLAPLAAIAQEVLAFGFTAGMILYRGVFGHFAK